MTSDEAKEQIFKARDGITAAIKAGAPLRANLTGWVALGSRLLFNAWVDAQGAISHLLVRSEDGFLAANQNLDLRLGQYASQAVALVSPRPAAPILYGELLKHVEYACYQLVGYLSDPRHAEAARRRRESQAPFLEEDRAGATTAEMAMAYMRAQLLDMAGNALAMQAQITEHLRGEEDRAETKAPDAAERMRLKRMREKRKIRHRVPVNVYDGDLDLLRRFGFIRGEGDRDGIARGLEALLLAGYLSRPAQTVSWVQRWSGQLTRLRDLHDTPEPDANPDK
jgi:hypothetical protein